MTTGATDVSEPVTDGPANNTGRNESELEHRLTSRMPAEHIEEFLERVDSVFTNNQGRYHITTSVPQDSVDEEAAKNIKKFVAAVKARATDYRIHSSKDDVDTDDDSDYFVTMGTPVAPKPKLREILNKFILSEAVRLKIVSGRWRFKVAHNKARDIYCSLVRMLTPDMANFHVDIECVGKNHRATISVWTMDFGDKNTVDGILSRVRSAPTMADFHGRMRYQPYVYFGILEIEDVEAWGISHSLYRFDVPKMTDVGE